MKKVAIFVSLLFVLSGVYGIASAQNKSKTKTYDFSGDTIDGELVRPDGDALDVQDEASFTSLIRIRRDFIQEILKTAENI